MISQASLAQKDQKQDHNYCRQAHYPSVQVEM